MEHQYIVRLADSIISPLGIGTTVNLAALGEGRTALRRHEDRFSLPEAFTASLFDEGEVSRACAANGIATDGLTRFEQLAVLSVAEALRGTDIDVTSPDVIFILSTTKGNVHLLDEGASPDDERLSLGHTACLIARRFGNPNEAFAVSNACVSGLSAQITAQRLLAAGRYRTAVVVGADVLSRFIVSGFGCLGALADAPCRPFDRDRKGLNLGEAAACIILGVKRTDELHSDDHVLLRGAVRNDANHISGPSRTAEGSTAALNAICADIAPEDIALVSLHGTATAYNDEMESIALHRTGLSDVPATSLKGVYGHTLGAAGVLETLLALHATAAGFVPATPGYEQSGVTYPVSVSAHKRATAASVVVKLMSGFGGVNAAVLYVSGEDVLEGRYADTRLSVRRRRLRTAHAADFRPEGPLRTARGEEPLPEGGEVRLRTLYDRYVAPYLRFFKLDAHSAAGFLTAEILLHDEPLRERRRTDRAVCSISIGGCLRADIAYAATCRPGTEYFPSPAAFVYTLPNVVTGETAIRRHLAGETSAFVLRRHDEHLIALLTETIFADRHTREALLLVTDTVREHTYSATGQHLVVDSSQHRKTKKQK